MDNDTKIFLKNNKELIAQCIETHDFSEFWDNNDIPTVEGERDLINFFTNNGFQPEDLLEGTEEIYPFAYSGAEFKEFTVPNGIIQIDQGAFEQCDKMTDIYIPAGVKHCESGIFEGCDISLNIHLAKGSLINDYAKQHGAQFNIEYYEG